MQLITAGALREWSLIIGKGGGYKTGGGGKGSFTPTKMGVRNNLAMLNGGTKRFEVVYKPKMGGRNKFPPFKTGGGGREKFWTHDFPIL